MEKTLTEEQSKRVSKRTKEVLEKLEKIKKQELLENLRYQMKVSEENRNKNE